MLKLTCLLLFLILIPTQTFVMEISSTQKKVDYSILPNEALEMIVPTNSLVYFKNEQNTDEAYSIRLQAIGIPKVFFNNARRKGSINLNNLEIHTNKKFKKSLFRNSCLLKNAKIISMKSSEFEHDSDIAFNEKINNFHFDGPNDHNFCIAVTKMDTSETFLTISNGTEAYVVKSIKNINSFALCKTQDRIAVATKHNVYILCIKEDCEAELVSLFWTDEFKKVSFITPNTLLGLSTIGKLIMLYLDYQPNQGCNISTNFSRKYIRDKKNNELKIDDFALDPCNPSQVILLISNQLLFYDMKYHYTKKLLNNIAPQQLWFYNDQIAFLDQHNKFHKYNLFYADVSAIMKILYPQATNNGIFNTTMNYVLSFFGKEINKDT